MIEGEVGRLADESLRLSLRQTELTLLLVTATQYAWLDLCLDGYRTMANILNTASDQRDRTRRLIQRGVPPEAAARALRIV